VNSERCLRTASKGKLSEICYSSIPSLLRAFRHISSFRSSLPSLLPSFHNCSFLSLSPSLALFSPWGKMLFLILILIFFFFAVEWPKNKRLWRKDERLWIIHHMLHTWTSTLDTSPVPFFFLSFLNLRFCSRLAHRRRFSEEPVARRELPRPVTTFAVGGPEPFLRLLLHNEGSSLFGVFFSVFLIRSDSKAEVRFGLRAAACLVTFGK